MLSNVIACSRFETAATMPITAIDCRRRKVCYDPVALPGRLSPARSNDRAGEPLIAVVDGPEIGSVAVGQTRHRSISPAVPLGIASITRDERRFEDQASRANRTRLGFTFTRPGTWIRRSPIEQLYLPVAPIARAAGQLADCPVTSANCDWATNTNTCCVVGMRRSIPGVMLPQPSMHPESLGNGGNVQCQPIGPRMATPSAQRRGGTAMHGSRRGHARSRRNPCGILRL